VDALSGAPGENRIGFLDGLRGIAIAWVMLFHAYVRWPEVVPYGNRYSGVPAVAYGWLGVELFFLISGFVILMTLEKSAGFRDFMTRRWLRLFPAMLVCSLLVFATAPLFPERPAGSPILRDLLPGLTFIDQTWWNLLLPTPQGVLEGAFWSLFVEMKFYLLAGFLFFTVGRARTIGALFALYALERLVTRGVAPDPASSMHWLALLLNLASAKYFGWFAAGALYYRYFRTGSLRLAVLAVLAALASALGQDGYQWHPELMALSVVAIFSAAMFVPLARTLLAHPLRLFLGFVSYPLYLIHENMMVASIAKVGAFAPGLPPALMPVLPMLLVISLAWLVARFAEPRLRELLRPRRRPAAATIDAATLAVEPPKEVP
jgi:peptidoglycan/LPS O-acetylase OafA/YrhL